MQTKIFEIFIPMYPVAKARARVTKKGFAYTPKKTKLAETEIKYFILQKKPILFERELPLKAEFVFQFKKPKSAPKYRLFPTVKPDCSNFLKLAEDAMNGVCYVDDCQLVDISVKKFYSDCEGIYIKLSPLF